MITEECEDDSEEIISSDVYYYNVNDFSMNGSESGNSTQLLPTLNTNTPSPFDTHLSITSHLSSRELHYLDFFLNRGSMLCSVGLPSIVNMWQTDGFQVALQSPLVFNAVCAFSSNMLEKGPEVDTLFPTKAVVQTSTSYKSPRRLYLHNAITLLRDQIARDKSTHKPLELALASYLIGACSLAEFDLIPVISRNGGADLFGITQGNGELFKAYYNDIENSFARVLVLHEYHHLLLEENRSRLADNSFEFINHLKRKLTEMSRLINPDESIIYLDTLKHINMLFCFALMINNMYPLMACFFGFTNEYRRKVRQGRPFALVIVAFLGAFYRRTVLTGRPRNDTWDQCIEEIVSQLPHDYRSLANDALRMRQGYKFSSDFMKFNDLIDI